jgi:hypothetical protein
VEKGETRTKILNISSNLRRIAQWAYEYPNEARQRNIKRFLHDTEEFIKEIEPGQVPPNISSRYQKFLQDFPKLKERWSTASVNHLRRLVWAEEILTWSNLLD